MEWKGREGRGRDGTGREGKGRELLTCDVHFQEYLRKQIWKVN